MRIVLYRASWSPECRVASRYFEQHGVDFETIEVTRGSQAAEAVQRGTGGRRLPALLVGTQWFVLLRQDGHLDFREIAEHLGLTVEDGQPGGETHVQ